MPYFIKAECPRCGTSAISYESVEKIFGFRTIGEKKIPQSHCRECRKEEAKNKKEK